MEPPIRPDDSDCCGSGCSPCIFEVYEEQLRRYRERDKETDLLHPTENNCISQTSYATFRLAEKKVHSKSTFLYTFRCKDVSDETKLRYNAGQHFLMRSEDRKFTRAYTPIPPQRDRHSFTILVKLYENGLMSKTLAELAVNAETRWRGPYGNYMISFQFQYILGIAQGTGVAPVYAVFHKLVENESCETFLRLFCCYRDSEDILLHDELYALSSNWNFTYELFLKRGDSTTGTKYNEKVNLRRLTCDDVERYLSGKHLGKLQVLICGSKDFNECWLEIVKKCGVKENVHMF